MAWLLPRAKRLQLIFAFRGLHDFLAHALPDLHTAPLDDARVILKLGDFGFAKCLDQSLRRGSAFAGFSPMAALRRSLTPNNSRHGGSRNASPSNSRNGICSGVVVNANNVVKANNMTRPSPLGTHSIARPSVSGTAYQVGVLTILRELPTS